MKRTASALIDVQLFELVAAKDWNRRGSRGREEGRPYFGANN